MPATCLTMLSPSGVQVSTRKVKCVRVFISKTVRRCGRCAKTVSKSRRKRWIAARQNVQNLLCCDKAKVWLLFSQFLDYTRVDLQESLIIPKWRTVRGRGRLD